MRPEAFTVNSLSLIDGELCGYCETCRVLRPVDLLALKVAGRGDQLIGDMSLRCEACGEPGQALVEWWTTKRESFTFPKKP